MRFALTLAVLALALPTAAAQAPFAGLTLTVTAPALDVVAGQAAGGPVSVEAAFSNLVCAQPSVIVVSLAVDKANLTEGMTATVEPAEVEITIPGPSLPVSTATGSGAAAFNLTTLNTTANGTSTLGVIATYAGGFPANCQGAGSIAETTGLGPVATTIRPPPPAPAPVAPQQTEETPAPGVLLVAAALGLVALVGRRRRA